MRRRKLTDQEKQAVIDAKRAEIRAADNPKLSPTWWWTEERQTHRA